MSLLAIEELEELSAPDFSDAEAASIIGGALVVGVIIGAALT